MRKSILLSLFICIFLVAFSGARFGRNSFDSMLYVNDTLFIVSTDASCTTKVYLNNSNELVIGEPGLTTVDSIEIANYVKGDLYATGNISCDYFWINALTDPSYSCNKNATVTEYCRFQTWGQANNGTSDSLIIDSVYVLWYQQADSNYFDTLCVTIYLGGGGSGRDDSDIIQLGPDLISGSAGYANITTQDCGNVVIDARSEILLTLGGSHMSANADIKFYGIWFKCRWK